MTLVLSAALIHATWNLLVKKSGGGIIFVWLFSTVTSLFLIPGAIAYLVIQTHSEGTLGIVFIVGTSLIHLAYFCCLQRGYQIGDLSVVYPLARGLGPTLATARSTGSSWLIPRSYLHSSGAGAARDCAVK